MQDIISLFSSQVCETEAALEKLVLPKREWKNAVLIGMGGSALGAHVAQTLFADKLVVPFEWRNSYTIPGYADEQTLVILSSYSGTTEEVLAAYKEAKARGLGIVVLTCGGKLAAAAKKDHAASVIYSVESNPGNQPRNGVVYNLVGVWGILKIAGLLKDEAKFSCEFAESLDKMAKKHEGGALAKKLARACTDSVVMLAASEHLEGNLHIIQNQTHETAKHFAHFDTVSELNHHLMEGLKYPNNFARKTTALLFHSKLYGTRIKKRYPITAEVLKKQNVKVFMIELSGKSREADVAEMLVLGMQFSLALAKLHGENPNFIPWVDYFKKKLAV
ncbi:MAG: SIS domain-containing protein [bacterium]